MDTQYSGKNLRQIVPFFWVEDLTASLRFYSDGLGFAPTNKWVDDGKIRWCRLQRGDVSIMVQEFWRERPHMGRPEGLLGQGVVIYFLCEDAPAFYEEVVSRNIIAGEPFVANHKWVTELFDPDGYKILFESKTDVPEETKYTDWQLANN
jgi:catechol 2,3-dioxygenase-like lactoylglutathione lyase family enzyme